MIMSAAEEEGGESRRREKDGGRKRETEGEKDRGREREGTEEQQICKRYRVAKQIVI